MRLGVTKGTKQSDNSPS